MPDIKNRGFWCPSTAWADAALETSPSLALFIGLRREEQIAKFRQLDEHLRAASLARITAVAAEPATPRGDGARQSRHLQRDRGAAARARAPAPLQRGRCGPAAAPDSLLDDCVAIFPVFDHAHLRSHYRSRDERLIKFSNHYFYREKPPVTFPSAATGAADRGVRWVFVEDGLWDRGGSRTNRAEARRVVALIVDLTDERGTRARPRR